MKKNKIDLPETITASRTDPIYNCHSYLTKVPIEAIKPFIEQFTEPGEIVADFFAGSGMTGLAALSLGRKARMSDISVLGQHIALGYLQNVSEHKFRAAADLVIKIARDAIGDFYETERISDGAIQEMTRTVWSFTYLCPACGNEMVYFEHIDANGKAPATCPSCTETFVKRKWVRGGDVPVRVVVIGEEGKLVEQPIRDFDIKKIDAAARDKRLKDIPSQPIESHREMYSRSGLGKAGMTNTGQFFSSRNGIALLELWRAINGVDDERIRRKLRFAFTAILPRASKRYQWGPKRPLNAQNQTYYIAPVYYEWNIFELFARKVNATVRASDELFGSASLFTDGEHDVTYDLLSADSLSHLEDGSVDYVFTDPPFGSNIFYSDMNLFHEAWLNRVTDYRSEAVVHTTGRQKSGAEERYENLLRGSFEEAWRILKPGKYLSVVFGNSRGDIWGVVQRALRQAGFYHAPIHVAILDKGQRSVKGLNSGSESVVTVDLVVTLQKPLSEEGSIGLAIEPTDTDKTLLIREAIRELSTNGAANPSHVYARILRKAIQKHMVLDNLHLTDVLIALRNAGYVIDHKTGKIISRVS